ncbi:MAG: hypothetical protein SOZ67_04165 [Alloprevotella sp.]|nr:hypothetical protein [Alloprevotella sp.]MDY4564825.1 hypothetical protein [Alloprevotella sp.]
MTLGVLESTLPDSQITVSHTNPTQQSPQNGVVCVGLVAKNAGFFRTNKRRLFRLRKADFSVFLKPRLSIKIPSPNSSAESRKSKVKTQKNSFFFIKTKEKATFAAENNH